MTLGWTWQRNAYEPALSAGTAYDRLPGPVKNAVSPIGTAVPLESWITTLCGAWLSWLSKTSVKAVSAFALSVDSAKPAVAAPVGAVTVTTGAFGSIDAAGAPDPLGAPDAPAPPVSAFR